MFRSGSLIHSLSVSIPLLIAGCTADALDGDAPAPAGKADDAQTAGDSLFVYHSGMVCAAPPCPAFVVVTEAGHTERVVRVVLPDPNRRVDRLGLVVSGAIERSADGNGILHVDGILGESPLYDAYPNGRVCATAPCPSYSATDVSGAEIDFSSANFEAVAGSPEQQSQLSDRLNAGSLVVRGFVAASSTPAAGPILYVTALLETDLIRFGRDSRPTGDYRFLELQRGDQGSYAALLDVKYRDPATGRNVNETKQLGTRFECDFSLAGLTCVADDRSAGGSLVELRILRNPEGTYDLSRSTTSNDGEPPGTTMEELASSLTYR